MYLSNPGTCDLSKDVRGGVYNPNNSNDDPCDFVFNLVFDFDLHKYRSLPSL